MMQNTVRLVAQRAALLLALGFSSAGVAHAAPCANEDMTTQVSAAGECVVIATFGMERGAPPRTLVIWLHGDQSGGGPATSHVRPARETATRFAEEGVVAVALWRPGYEDAQGRVSGGDSNGRVDHYTQANVSIVTEAISRLKAHWKPQRTILVGHSGGAATVAIALGMQPGIADAALLLSCPCDLRAWRARRTWWPRSEDPLKWAGKVDAKLKLLAMTGSADDNTSPQLAQAYVDAVRAIGVEAAFRLVDGATHNSILAAPSPMEGLGTLIK